MSIIHVENLTKCFKVAQKQPGFAGALRHFFHRQYKTVDAVRDASFRIEPGEIVGFLGPNGAGKTTTLKMLTGLIHPTSGSVQVAGFTPYHRHHDFLRRITLVMGQKQQLLWDLPAMDSLRINAAVYGIDDAEFKRRAQELADMLALGDQLRQPVRKLSLGERMKAELMAALLHRPQILFLDEPTLGLDINAQAAVREFLRQYNRRHNATVLMTSHYMADITALCPRVILIHHGRLNYDGSLAGLLERLAPHRQVSLEFAQPVDPAALAPFGHVERIEGTVANLLIPRDALTENLNRLLEQFDVLDMTVTDPPIEKVIGQLFRSGLTLEPAATPLP
jgi:ABC-2 type transport system ATP-binding protein